jgi:hypothetical protein
VRRRALAALAAAAVLAVAGCADGGDPTSSTAGATTAATPPRPLASLGLRVMLPSGWEGRIRRSGARAVLHLASFALPPTGSDDLAGAAVEAIPRDGVVIALVEMGEDVLGSVLYANEGVPEIAAAQIAPGVASGPIPEGAGGVQRFFTAAGRPFMLYVAVGAVTDADRLAAEANQVLRTLRVARGR